MSVFWQKNDETGFVYGCFTNILLFPSMPVISKDTWIFAKLVSSKCFMISRNSGKSASSETQLRRKGVHRADSNPPPSRPTNRFAHVSEMLNVTRVGLEGKFKQACVRNQESEIHCFFCWKSKIGTSRFLQRWNLNHSPQHAACCEQHPEAFGWTAAATTWHSVDKYSQFSHTKLVL